MKNLLTILILTMTSNIVFADIYPKTIQSFIEQSMNGLELQTQSHMNTWNLGQADNWNVDQETGKISWTFSDGSYLESDVQIIGTYSKKSGTFLWAWAHPSILQQLAKSSELVKAYGEKHKIEKFTTRKVSCTEAEAWEFTAIANQLANSNGAYRGNGYPKVFMTFGEVTMKKSKP